MNEDVIDTLKKEITYLKGKRVNKKKIKHDIDDLKSIFMNNIITNIIKR